MSPSRRRLLQATAPTILAGLAGCTSDGFSNSDQSTEYTLSIDTVAASPTEHALYELSDDPLFGDPARAALADIIPEGTHRTYGYTPLPEDGYVAGEGRYFQIKTAITGRQEMDRTLIGVESLDGVNKTGDQSGASDGAEPIHVDSLDRPSARVLKILHTNSTTDGTGASAELLRGDAYVLRRPAERESEVATGEFDGQIVSMTKDGGFPYRVSVSTDSISETEYTTQAIPVADSEAAFREVVFAAEIDAEVDDASLSTAACELLDRTLGGEHSESTPLSAAFEAVLAALGVATADESLNGRLLWYDDQLYRYGLYIDTLD